jgi:hypothetical protein
MSAVCCETESLWTNAVQSPRSAFGRTDIVSQVSVATHEAVNVCTGVVIALGTELLVVLSRSITLAKDRASKAIYLETHPPSAVDLATELEVFLLVGGEE